MEILMINILGRIKNPDFAIVVLMWDLVKIYYYLSESISITFMIKEL